MALQLSGIKQQRDEPRSRPHFVSMDLGENHSLSFYCHLLLLSKTPICCYCCRGGKMQCLVSSLVRLWFYSIFLGKSSPKTRSLLWEHHQVMSMCRISNQYTNRTRAEGRSSSRSSISDRVAEVSFCYGWTFVPFRSKHHSSTRSSTSSFVSHRFCPVLCPDSVLSIG